MEKLKLFVVAGEKSGDNLGGSLVKAFKNLADAEVYGTGGSLLLAEGQKQFYDINDLNAIGLGEALRKLPFLLKVKEKLMKELANLRPDAVILIDYPGFNLRFAKEVKKLGIPVIFYVSPTFWVWHYSRVHQLRQFCDLVLCIYPFEPETLIKEGVNAVYVGNPLKGQFSFKCADRQDFMNRGSFDGSKKIIGLLPGSRKREVRSLLPVMVNAAKQLKQYDFVVAVADTIDEEMVRGIIKGSNIRLATGLTHDIMKHSDLLWVCSGTASLESAIIGTPMIIMYKTGYLTYTVGKMVCRTKFVGMPNIIMKRSVVPEILQADVNAYSLMYFTDKLEQGYERVKEDLAQIGELFPDIDTPAKAAGEIYSLLKQVQKGK